MAHAGLSLRFLCPLLCAGLALGASPWPPAARARAQALVAQLSQDEKLSLMQGTGTGAYAGSLPAIARLGIPALTLEDGPQGVGDGLVHVTAWPSALAAAASWDADLAFRFGKAMGEEQFGKGTNVMLGPGTNLARVPWNGRLYEYYSEEPALSGPFVSAVVRGVQTSNVSACVKHHLGNSQEFDRGGEDAQIPERALHELYLPAFAAAADAGAGSFMLGVNKVRGLENSADKETIDLLFVDHGFQGFMVTDWAGIVVPNASAAALAGTSVEMPRGIQYQYLPLFIANGTVPISTIDNLVVRVLTTAAALGILDTPPSADRNTAAVVTSPAHTALAREIGGRAAVLLKNSVPVGDQLPILPFSAARFPRGLLVLGDESTATGCGSGEVQRPYVVSTFAGLYSALNPTAKRPNNCTLYPDVDFFQDGATCVTVSTAANTSACCALCAATASCNFWTLVNDNACPGQPMPQPAGQCFLKPTDAGRTPHAGLVSGACASMPPSVPPLFVYAGQDAGVAAALAPDFDVVLYVAALPSVEPNPGCEGNDRLTLALDGWQDAMITAVAATNPRVVVVTRTGGAVLMPWLDSVATVLHTGLTGQESGNALADVLLGAVNPSGKLTVTFPSADNATWLLSASQYPGVLNATTGFYETHYS